MLKLAEAMENSALAMERRLAGNHERLEGILRISSAEWFANYVLAPVLEELTRRHPATNRRMAHTQASCRLAERALTHNCKKYPDVAPFHASVSPYKNEH